MKPREEAVLYPCEDRDAGDWLREPPMEGTAIGLRAPPVPDSCECMGDR